MAAGRSDPDDSKHADQVSDGGINDM
jgi:hypothetical protein